MAVGEAWDVGSTSDGGGTVCVGGDSTVGVKKGRLQATVSVINPIRKNLNFILFNHSLGFKESMKFRQGNTMRNTTQMAAWKKWAASLMDLDQQYNCWSKSCGDGGN